MRLPHRRILHQKRLLSGIHRFQPDKAKALKAYIKDRNSSTPSLFLSCNNVPISRWRLDELMKHYGELADVPESKRHFHVLKHSIATHLLDAGADLHFVHDWAWVHRQHRDLCATHEPQAG
jgi:site-specific recombinase XerD